MMWQHNGTSINKRKNVVFGYTVFDYVVDCSLCTWHTKYTTLAIARAACTEHAALHVQGQEPLPLRELA